MHWPRSGRTGAAAAPAPLRRRGAPEDRDGHVRRRHRRPVSRIETPQLVVGCRRRERDGRTWTLPKGTPNAGETTEQTALREVAEETGLEVRITGPLDSIEYWFVQSAGRGSTRPSTTS